MTESADSSLSTQSVDLLNDAYVKLQEQIRKVIVGQDEVIEQLLIALFSQGHVLLEGVPGLAKTLMVSTVARSLTMTERVRIDQRGLTFSLSQRERAGVRENGCLACGFPEALR